MSKLFLDLSKMTSAGKKGEHAIFEHKDGHQIYVKSSSLTPNMRKQLEDLVKTKMAKGGKVEAPQVPMAEGGEPEQIPINLTNPQITETPPPAQEAPPTTPSRDEPYRMDSQMLPLSNLPETIPPHEASPPLQEAPPEAAPQAVPPSSQMPEPKAPEQPSISGGLTKGIQEQGQGIEQEAKAKAQQAQGAAHAIEANQINRQMADQHYQEQLQHLDTERQALQEDIKNGHIDPSKYISDMSVPQKLATGIGLILGGIGGGLTHQENPALKFLNSQIDRNIDAQVKELGKKENLLSANFRQFGNIQSARDFTRINMNDQLKNQIDLATAKAGTPMAQAEGLKAKGALDQQSGMLMAKIGAIQTINSPHAKDGDVSSAIRTLELVDPEQAKIVKEKYVPGVGLGSVPVPPPVREQLLAKQNFATALKEYRDWSAQHTGQSLKSYTSPAAAAELRRGQAMAQQAQQMYQQGVLGGIFKAGEQPRMDAVINGGAGSLFNKVNTLPQLDELIRTNEQLTGRIKTEYGIPNSQQQNQQSAPAPRFTPRK